MRSSANRFVLAAITALVVAACSGGGGGSSSTATSATTARHVTGAISGFGSVIVNGVHYDSSSASVTLDGHAGSVSDLKVGQVVHIDATVDSTGHATATSIAENRLVQGTVTAVDLVNDTLTVAGQTIQVDGNTSFDPSVPGGALSGIQVNDRVEVHGFVGAGGVSVATRIEMANAGDSEIEVTGPIASLDTTMHRFTVGTQVVDYSTAALNGFPSTGPADGDIVEAQGTTVQGDGSLLATSVSKEDGDLEGGNQGDAGEMEGLVTAITDATHFQVNGQNVSTTGATIYVGGTAADVALNVHVEVHGSLDSSGTLVADKVVFEHPSSLEVSATADSVNVPDPINNPNVGTVVMLGVTFEVQADTRVEDDEASDQYFNLTSVNAGDWLEVSGYPDPADATKIIVRKLERHSAQSEVTLRGLDDNLDETNATFTIFGIQIATTSTTTFASDETPIDAHTFYTGATGQDVEVDGTWSAPTLTANTVQLDGSQSH